MGHQTISATEFKAKCLDILDRVNSGKVDRVEITKRGTVVAVLTAPVGEAEAIRNLYGFMQGTVILPEDLDLTAPVLDEPLDAEQGILHR